MKNLFKLIAIATLTMILTLSMASAAFAESAADIRDAGYCYHEGINGYPKDLGTAWTLFNKAADMGDGLAIFYIAEMCEAGEVEGATDELIANLYFQTMDAGIPESGLKLGILYSEGRGVRQDDERAASMFAYSAYFGVSAAQFNLGLCYEMGIGVEQSDSRAIHWYEEAAAQGNAEAQYRLDLLK